jgi:surface carbohydrate biosynthesis protein
MADRRLPAHGGGQGRGILYLPIEVSARELDSKLLLAHRAAAAGLEAVIGQKWLLQRNIAQMPPGVLLFKTMTTRDAKAMAEARAQGYRIAAIDEEAPGIDARAGNLRWIAADAIAQCDAAFALGGDHRDALVEKFPAQRDKIEIAGNPRWDLLRPEFRAAYAEETEAIRREFGRIILINTNFATTNSAKGPPEKIVANFKKAGKLDMNNPADAELIDSGIELERLLFTHVTEMLRRLPEAFPGHRVVLRPHPNENIDTWRGIMAGLPRAALERRGSAIAWILASDALVHPYCTTGVEAFALGKPAICYKPRQALQYDLFLSSKVNFLASDIDAVIARIRDILAAGDGFRYPQAMHDIYDHAFAAQEGSLSADRIAARVAALAASQGNGAAAGWRPAARFSRWMWLRHHKDSLVPRLGPRQVLDRLLNFGARLGDSGRFAVSQVGDRLFHIAAAAENSAVDRCGPPPLWLRTFPRYAAAARPAAEPVASA